MMGRVEMGGECYVPIISDVVKFTPLKKWFKGNKMGSIGKADR